MAAAAGGLPAMADGAWLFPALAHVGGLDPAASNVVFAGAFSGRPQALADARYHGRSVREDQRKGGVRGFDGHKRIKGRKRHILVDVLGIPIANRVGAANISDPVAGSRLLAGLAPLWPTIRWIIADAGHESRKLAAQLRRDGWELRIFKRKQRAFKVGGLTWIVERSFAWLGFNRRLSKDFEHHVQTSETMLDIAAVRLMLNRIAE
jgi:putative transposase